MNVLVVNQQEDILTPLNIEIIKTLRGTFTADEIISTFTNFFFARMIIDVTALKDGGDVVTFQKLSIGLPIDKVILLIPPSSPVANSFFLSKLISMGYYNFTTNGDGVLYLLNTPNTYKEVAHLHKPEVPVQSDQPGMGMGGPQMGGQPNFGPMNNVPMNNGQLNNVQAGPSYNGIRVLGVKDVTDGAGASSLIYMMKKELEQTFGMSVLAIEVDKREFAFFREDNMISVEKQSLATELIKTRNFNFVLVDLNDYEEPICDDVIYLLEPSVIKLNKLMLKDRTVFTRLKDRKIVINKSTLSPADVSEFSSEAGVKIFYVLPSINDRERSREICSLLMALGMVR